MIEVHAFATPNSVKVPIFLEEAGLPYSFHAVNIREGQQRRPEFVAMNPNAKVPVIVDPDGPDGRPLTLTESGAILVYLAEKTGRLLPAAGTARARAFEWLAFQLSASGPMFGQAGYFQRLAPEPVPFAIERFAGEAKRAAAVMDQRLAEAEWFAGSDYTIADIAHFGWIWRRSFAGIDLDGLPNLARWTAAMEARPAVQRAIARVGG